MYDLFGSTIGRNNDDDDDDDDDDDEELSEPESNEDNDGGRTLKTTTRTMHLPAKNICRKETTAKYPTPTTTSSTKIMRIVTRMEMDSVPH